MAISLFNIFNEILDWQGYTKIPLRISEFNFSCSTILLVSGIDLITNIRNNRQKRIWFSFKKCYFIEFPRSYSVPYTASHQTWFTQEKKQSKYHRFLIRHFASSGFSQCRTWHAICTTTRTEGKVFFLRAASRGLLLLHIASRITAGRIDWQQNTYKNLCDIVPDDPGELESQYLLPACALGGFTQLNCAFPLALCAPALAPFHLARCIFYAVATSDSSFMPRYCQFIGLIFGSC